MDKSDEAGDALMLFYERVNEVRGGLMNETEDNGVKCDEDCNEFNH